jgi:hypothetical protein
MPSNHGVISTDSNIHQEPFTIPDVKTMDKPTLKSELLRLEVCTVGNPNKEILQEKLLMAYNIELIYKVATIYRNYHNCHYRIYQKKKSHVSFACTRYQVIAPGLNELPWTDYKSCVRFINKYNEDSKLNITQLDIKNNSRSCPGKMIVNIVNGTVGLPYFPHPFHLCGNVMNTS